MTAKDLHPQQACYVGVHNKVRDAVMCRMRTEGFGVIKHEGGIPPACPPLMSGLKFNQADSLATTCIRCDTCDR